jgi:hypothetical protein
MRLEPLVAKKHVDLERFQSVQQLLQNPSTAEAAQSQLKPISCLLFSLCEGLRDRGLAEDMKLLEALTVFDVNKERKTLNWPRASEYMQLLLNARPDIDELQHGRILNACASWFSLQDDEQYNSELGITQYFGLFIERPELEPFVLQALF